MVQLCAATVYARLLGRHHRPRTTFRITITRLLVPKEPSGRNPSSRYIDSVPPQINELEYFFPRGIAIGYPSTVPPPLALMRRSAPSSAALATPSRLWSRTTKKHVVLQSGGSTSIVPYPLIRPGSSTRGPNRHHPTTSGASST